MKKLLLAALICFGPTMTGAAQPIAQGDASHTSNVVTADPSGEAVIDTDLAGLTLRLLGDNGSVLASLFQNLRLTPSDIGKTSSATTTTPGFGDFVSLLTDEIAHKFLAEFWVGDYGAGAGGGGRATNREYDGFGVIAPPGPRPGLAGFSIGRIEFRLDDNRIIWHGSNAVETSIAATYSVYAPVPEPSTLLMATTGIIALSFVRLRFE